MLRPVRRAIKRAAKRLGYEIVPSLWMPSAVFAEHLRSLFTRLSIDCVLDVGANRGQYREFLREFVDYRGRIISFEPIPYHVEHLRAAARGDDLWSVENYALGCVPGELSLNVMAVDTFSSFLAPDHTVVPQFNDQNIVREVRSVPVKRLDEVLPALRQRFKFENVYLKMDTQGFDMQVVEGAGAELESVRALQTELAIKTLYRGMPAYDEVLRVLTCRGFELATLSIVSADQWMRAIECDLVMVNQLIATASGA